MNCLRLPLLRAALLAPALLPAQPATVSGTVSAGASGAFLDGDRPAFQELLRQRKTGAAGIEELRVTREAPDALFRFEATLMPGDDRYRFALRQERTRRFYVDAGAEQFRVWYDGSGGVFLPLGTSFVVFNEELSLTRRKVWAEVGAWTPDQTLFAFRWERRMRDGTKSSTHWADSNLVGTFGTRSIVPSFYEIDEATDDYSLTVRQEARDDTRWGARLRYTETSLHNRRHERRRPFESADRSVTQKDESSHDLFTATASYERRLSEQLTVTAGALRTTFDGILAGSRIYGQTLDPVYDPAYLRRQQRDEGYTGLHGTADLRQTVLTANAVYLPAPHWSVRTSLRFENTHQSTLAEFVETNIGAGPAFAAILEDVEGEHRKTWDEFGGALEVRHTGRPGWIHSAKAEWIRGEGNHEEERMLHHTGQLTIDREMEYTRSSQRCAFTSTWFARPGVTLAIQGYYKSNVNDYDARRDNTVSASDRYPAFITDQDFETYDLNVRLTWRPRPGLNVVTRYDHQQSRIRSQDAGLEPVTSARGRAHVISQSATWSPAGRLYVTGNLNLTYDTLRTPTLEFAQYQDNNYVNASLACGYAAGKVDDLYLDWSWFRADNFIDRSATLIPFGVGQRTQQASLTWRRKQTAHLIYTFKYGYVGNRDETWAGLNDFDAHVLHARVQYRF
jgi:hypothetical protein